MSLLDTLQKLNTAGFSATINGQMLLGGTKIVADKMNPVILYIENPFTIYQEEKLWILNYGYNDQYLLIPKVANSSEGLVEPLIQYHQLSEDVGYKWLRQLIIKLNSDGVVVEIHQPDTLRIYIIDPDLVDNYYDMIVKQSQLTSTSTEAVLKKMANTWEMTFQDGAKAFFPLEASYDNQIKIIDAVFNLRA